MKAHELIEELQKLIASHAEAVDFDIQIDGCEDCGQASVSCVTLDVRSRWIGIHDKAYKQPGPRQWPRE